MWNQIVNIVTSGVTACFTWFADLMNALPGAWDTIFTIVVIILISKFLLGPLLGTDFSAGSDMAADFIVTKGKQMASDRAKSTKGLQRISRQGSSVKRD